MSCVQLNYYSNIDTSIIDMQNTADGLFIGHHTLTLTNYTTTGLPAIAASSKVENNGAFFSFPLEQAISGSPSDGIVYIYLVPSGDPALGTAIVTPTFTNTAPTWNESKRGLYGTGGSANYRYLEFVMTKASALYSNKRPISHNDIIDDCPETYLDANGTWIAPKSKYYTFWMTGKGGTCTNVAGPYGSGGAGATAVKRIFVAAGTTWTASFSASEGGSCSFSDGSTTLTVANANQYTGGASHSGMDLLIPGANGVYTGAGVAVSEGATSYYGAGAPRVAGSPAAATVYGSGGNITTTFPYFGAGKQGIIRIIG